MASKFTGYDMSERSVVPHDKEVSPATSHDLHDVPDPNDPAAPSKEVSSKRQSLSDLFTIFCAGAALISDGYQNSLMTMTNVVLKSEYKKQYTSKYSTQVSNALLVGEIIGQITIGLTCDCEHTHLSETSLDSDISCF